ncbi:MAG: hypothetical protein HYX57_04000 [Chloroflexi bacterium]|nr:hypothetical protein [Chloroflexota bacterium]
MKGGLYIEAPSGPYVYACTSGFEGRPNGSGPLPAGYVLTAGHCLDTVYGSGLGATWKHTSVPVTALGTGATEKFFNNTFADVGAIYDTESGAKNQLYGSSKTDIRSITGKKSNAQQIFSSAICRVGWASSPQYSCGTINVVDATVLESTSGYHLIHQWGSSVLSTSGDSGGAFFYGTTAYGILSTGNASSTFYGTIDWISYQASVRPCYNAACT